MCPLLAQLIVSFFSFFAPAVYSTNEANKAGLKQSIFLDVYGYTTLRITTVSIQTTFSIMTFNAYTDLSVTLSTLC
jgi:hypothetical protein